MFTNRADLLLPGGYSYENCAVELNDQQQAASSYSGDAQCLLVTAGAGCGKTKTIIARAVHLVKTGTSPSRILMMTFTNRAAREMKGRMKRDIGPLVDEIQAGTFHSFCYKALNHMPQSFDITGLSIIDADDQEALMRRVQKQFTSKLTRDQVRAMASPSDLIKYLSYSRNTCQSPDNYLPHSLTLNLTYRSFLQNFHRV